jgi:hypothetical protein
MKSSGCMVLVWFLFIVVTTLCFPLKDLITFWMSCNPGACWKVSKKACIQNKSRELHLHMILASGYNPLSLERKSHVLLAMLFYARRVHERLVLLSPFMRELGKNIYRDRRVNYFENKSYSRIILFVMKDRLLRLPCLTRMFPWACDIAASYLFPSFFDWMFPSFIPSLNWCFHVRMDARFSLSGCPFLTVLSRPNIGQTCPWRKICAPCFVPLICARSNGAVPIFVISPGNCRVVDSSLAPLLCNCLVLVQSWRIFFYKGFVLGLEVEIFEQPHVILS